MLDGAAALIVGMQQAAVSSLTAGVLCLYDVIIVCMHRVINTAKRCSYDHRAEDPEEQQRIQTAGGFIARSR